MMFYTLIMDMIINLSNIGSLSVIKRIFKKVISRNPFPNFSRNVYFYYDGSLVGVESF